MKIVFIFNSLTAEFGADLLTAFPKTDEVIFISLLENGPSIATLTEHRIKVFNLNGFHGYSKSSRLRGLRLLLRLPKLVRQVRDILKIISPEVVHTNFWLSDIVGILAARNLVVKIFSTQHDEVSVPLFIRVLKMRLLRRVTKVVAISNSVANFTQHYFSVPASKVVVIKNGIKIDSFASAIRPENEWQPILGIVARLELIKGHEYLFRALALLKKQGVVLPRLEIVGQGSQGKFLRTLAVELDIISSIVFCGYNANIIAELRKIDILIQPSVSEGLGISIIEGLASQKLIIGSDVGGIPELIKNHQTGLLIEPANFESLANALVWAITHRADALKLASNGHRWLLENKNMFDIHSTAMAYRKLYE